MTLQTVLDEIQERPGSGDVIPIIDPVTEEQITQFTDCGEKAVDDAVARAKASYEAGVWTDLPGRERAKILWRIADLIEEHAEELAQIDSANTGMPLMQAQLIVPTCAEFFRYYAGWCTKVNGTAYDVKTSGIASDTYVSQHAYTLKEPAGVVGPDLPVEWAHHKRDHQARPASDCGVQPTSSSQPRRPRCRRSFWPRSSPRPACRTASSTWSPATATPWALRSLRIPTSRRSRLPARPKSAR